MAVIEYEIHFGDGEPYVTTKVIAVGDGDKIRFKSNNPQAGIEYRGRSPFSPTADAPQPDKAFLVGEDTTEEFDVVQHLTERNRIMFDCGVVQAVIGQPAPGSFTQASQTTTYKLTDRYTGEGTPNA